MIISLKKPPIFKNSIPFELKLSSKNNKDISMHWQKVLQEKNDIFNGDVYVIASLNKHSNQLVLEIAKTTYATILYSRQTEKIKIHSLFSALLLKTSDNFYVTIIDKDNQVNLLGGMASSQDFNNKIYNPLSCIKRELEEELGLNIFDQNTFKTLSLKYLKCPSVLNKNSDSIGTIYFAELHLTRQELEEYYDTNKAFCDQEIKFLNFNTKDDYMTLKAKILPSRTYILDVIKALTKA